MTQEYIQLLLKDLCARLPYGVIMNTPNGDGHLCSINQTIFGNEYGINIKSTRRDYFNDEKINFKPYLRPMSSMTEEEIKELSEIDMKRLIFSSRHLTWHLDGEVIDYLNKKMFDWRGLIPKGLALEAPEGMYKINNNI